ncbi:hypothetical protein RFI_35735, partial [Reticulomyxa filosa]
DVRIEWEKTTQERDKLATANADLNTQNAQLTTEAKTLRQRVSYCQHFYFLFFFAGGKKNQRRGGRGGGKGTMSELEKDRENWKKAQSEEWKKKYDEMGCQLQEWKKKYELDTNELKSENNALKKKIKSLQSALVLFVQQNGGNKDASNKEARNISAMSMSTDLLWAEEKMTNSTDPDWPGSAATTTTTTTTTTTAMTATATSAGG